MKTPSFKPADLAAGFKTRAFRAGGYSVASSVIVLAIAVVINILAGAIPAKYTQFDTTANGMFSISDQTEKLLSGMDSEVDIYWIVRDGYEDTAIELLLSRYEALSGKLKVTVRDPDVYPAFIQPYTDAVSDNSLIVTSGTRWRYVDSMDMYEYDYSNYYTTGTYDVSFAGEGAITSAIDYVLSDDLPVVYTLTGHGEASLPSSFETAVQRENIELRELSLLTVEAVPDDAGAVLIGIPQSDISEQEGDMLLEYLQSGGKIFLITQPPEERTLANLEALMARYGVMAQKGIVVEGNQGYFAWNTPYYLLPDIGSHEITAPLTQNGYRVVLPIAQGLTISSDIPDGVAVTELLTTSGAAFSKTAGWGMDTYEKEDGDIGGPFALAVAVTEELGSGEETQLIWVSSPSLIDESADQMVSGANSDFFLNALGWMCRQEESAISIRAKSLQTEVLTMSGAASSSLSFWFVGVIPLVYLAAGIYIRARRRHR